MAKVVIFDMDGVISDTQILHASVDVMVMKSYGIKLTEEEINQKFAGIPDEEMFEDLFKAHGAPGNIQNIQKAIEEKWKMMMKRANDSIAPIPGILELIDKLKEKNFKLAVASSSPLTFINTVLSKLHIKEQFEVIVSGEEARRGKPHPEIFMLTAKRLKVRPDECVVIEDSLNGMRAAKEARMGCIGLVRKTRKSFPEGNHPADIVVSDLNKLTLGQIEKVQRK